MEVCKLESGRAYLTTWGDVLRFKGVKGFDVYHEELDAHRASDRYEFEGVGSVFLDESEVERFVMREVE